MTLPASSVISAVRLSHSSWSNGLTFESLKIRSTRNVFGAWETFRAEVRLAETGATRRRVSTRAVDTTSSRASIMVVTFQFHFKLLVQPLSGVENKGHT